MDIKEIRKRYQEFISGWEEMGPPDGFDIGHVVRHAGIRERSLRKNGGTSNPQDAGSKPAASRAEEPRMRGELPCRHAVDGTDAEPLYPPGSTSEPLLATEIGSVRDGSRC